MPGRCSPSSGATSTAQTRRSRCCGSVNVKNRDGLYTGERGFVVDLAEASLGRVPDGPELRNPRAAGVEEKERIRLRYLRLCLD